MRRGLDQGLSAAEAAACRTRGRAAVRGSARGRRRSPARGDRPLRRGRRPFGARREPCCVRPGGDRCARWCCRRLKEVGDGWKRGEIEISEEHFASNLIRGRLLALARFWGRGTGPLALLACAPGEMHDITLLAFALVLRSHGWRILFLGADTPIADARPRGRDDQAGARRRLELRHRPARSAGLRPPPAGPGGAARARGPRRNGRPLRPARRPPPGRGPRRGSRRGRADVDRVRVLRPDSCLSRRARIERAQFVPLSVEDSFAFFADAYNLEALTPPWLRFRILTSRPIPMHKGTTIQYVLSLHRFPVRWRTEIVEWEPGLRFVDSAGERPVPPLGAHPCLRGASTTAR